MKAAKKAQPRHHATLRSETGTWYVHVSRNGAVRVPRGLVGPVTAEYPYRAA